LIVSSNEEQTVFIKHNLLNLIYRQSIVASILIVFVSGLLSYQLKYTFGEDFGLVWYVSICTIVTAQVALYGATNIFGVEFQNRSYPIYQALLLLHSLVWGGGAAFYTLQLGSTGSTGLIGLITLYTAIVAGIVVLAYAPLRNLAVMTATLTLLPMISALFLNSRQLDNYEGLGLLVMLGALVFTSIVMARGIQKNLKSTFELEHKQRELESARLKAEHAVELRGQFVASLSHEIRTPLNVVQGMAELLQQYPEPLDPELSHKIDIIADSAEHLNSLVTDVLDFARIDSNKHSVENRRFDILELSESLVSQYQIQAAQKGVQLQFVTDQLDYQFYVGPIRHIRQILINLLSNAVKYTDAGEIQLSLSDQTPGFVQIRVSDTGCGISQEELRDIFQPYYQASKVGIETPNSTGLGLTIVNQLVTLMGGKIEVQSQPSRGTIFTSELPLELAHNQIDEEHSYLSAEQSADIGKLSILVADDSELNLELFKSFFARMGQSITQVRSGQEALDAYKLETYQVVVLDMQMEVMGGLTACREIRALEKRLDDQPALIIVQSADNRPANEQYAIDAGADYFLAKPFKVGELSRILNRAFDTSLASEVPEPQDAINAQISKGHREALEQVLLAARAAVERGDRDALGHELHKLKGNCAMIGLTRLQRICGEIEADVSDTSLSLAQLGDSLEILVKLVDKEVRSDTRAS